MPDIDQTVDEVAALEALDLHQFRESGTDNFALEREAIAATTDQLQQACIDLIYDRLLFRTDNGGIPTIAGAQLDQWGLILDVSRDSRSDADYLRLLRAELQILRSHATQNEIISIAAALFGVDAADMTTHQTPPASFWLSIDYGADTPLGYDAAQEAVDRLIRAVANGVGMSAVLMDDDTWTLGGTGARALGVGLLALEVSPS